MSGQETLLDRRRDDYGTVRITENHNGHRLLYFGAITEQSCVDPADAAHLQYQYTRAMLLGCYWARPRPDMTLLGLGGGALTNALVAHFDPGRVRVVELRAEVLALAREWLALSDDPRLHVHVDCAEKYIATAQDSCDLLFVDLYMEGGLSRLHVQAQFFLRCQQALRPGGVLVINQWQMGNTGLPYAASMFAETFGDQFLQVPVSEGNVILFIPAAGDPPLALDRASMSDWATALQERLGYSLQPYVDDLQRAADALAALT